MWKNNIKIFTFVAITSPRFADPDDLQNYLTRPQQQYRPMQEYDDADDVSDLKEEISKEAKYPKCSSANQAQIR